MKIRGSTICFKSKPEFFEKEQDGKKKNTVRGLGFVESKELEVFKDKITHIQIVNADNGAFFVRELTDISEWAGVTIFSWN